MRTGDMRRAPSGTALRTWAAGLLLVMGASLGAVWPAVSVAAASTPTAVPVPSPLAAAHLALRQTVDRTTAAPGEPLTYTITLSNTGGLEATAVTVTEGLSGTAAYLVADGSHGTTNSFAGVPVVPVTRVLTGHYVWSYGVVGPGVTDVVRFSAVIMPRGSQPAGTNAVTLTSTASSPGVAPAVVTTTAAVAHGVPRGSAARVPATGSGIEAAVAGFLLLGGLGLILLAMYVRERELASAGARRPGPSR